MLLCISTISFTSFGFLRDKYWVSDSVQTSLNYKENKRVIEYLFDFSSIRLVRYLFTNISMRRLLNSKKKKTWTIIVKEKSKLDWNYYNNGNGLWPVLVGLDHRCCSTFSNYLQRDRIWLAYTCPSLIR